MRGRDRSEVHIEIEAIALVDGDLAALGQDMQGRVQRACPSRCSVCRCFRARSVLAEQDRDRYQGGLLSE